MSNIAEPTEAMIDAAVKALFACNFQGFLCGKRHVIRDINAAPGEQEVWSLTTEDYDAGHAAMEIECDRLEMREALRAALSQAQPTGEKT